MLSLSKSRWIRGAVCIRSLSIGSKNRASHYDILEITPKATQSDIKSAYYKLSKIYHPDKSDDEAAAKKFRAITEAYEVLGNIKLKKMYDKGLLVGTENISHRMEYQQDAEPTDPTLKFYKSRGKRQVVPTMDGRTPIYNFDAWSRHHYGSLFEKQKYERDFVRKTKAKQDEARESSRQETFLFCIFALTGLFVVLVTQGTSNHDINRLKEEENRAKDQP